MKKIIILLTVLTTYSIVKAQNTCCYPDENGMYTYYLNLKTENLKSKRSFSKENLFSLLKSSKKILKKNEINLENEIKEVFISFPTAQTEIVQRSISLKSPNPDLDIQLSEYTDIFNFVEKKCHPNPIEMLTYESNDYELWDDSSGHLELIKAPQAWEITKGDPRILIGITDTKIETTHEDLKLKITQVLQNNENATHHGIAVAGCAAGDTDNGVGIASVGFKSKLIFSSKWADDNEVLRLAQMPGVRVINCSWINNCYYSATQDALYKEIRDTHNVIVTFGAGNGASHCGSVTAYVYPASYESVISVTSVGHSFDYGTILPVYGKHLWKDCHEITIGENSHQHNDKVDICAPGYRVTTTKSNNSYGTAWGTSFAAPIVAGTCALVASVNPCLTAKEIQEIVISTADASIYDIPENAPYIGLLGSGRLDAYAAVHKALELGTIYIQNKSYYGTDMEEAATQLFAGNAITNNATQGNVIITSGSDVTFKATKEIGLSSGFEVQIGASFSIEIYESNCY